MIERLGVTKSDVELLISVLLSVFNFYWMIKFNNMKYTDQMFKILKDKNDAQEEELTLLKHRVAVHKALSRRTNDQKLA